MFALEPGALEVRAYSLTDDEPEVKVSRRLPQDLIEGGAIRDPGHFSSELRDARREVLGRCDARKSEDTLILPPLATLDRVILTPSLGARDITAAVLTKLGPLFGNRRLYAMRWATLGAGPDAGSMAIYASVCRHSTVREYRKALVMSGMPCARIEPHLASIAALCPGAGEAYAAYRGADDVWRVLLTEAGRLRDLRLHYTGIPDDVPPGLLQNLSERPDLPIIVCTGTGAGGLPIALLSGSERMIAPRHHRSIRFPVSFGVPVHRHWAGPTVAATLIAVQVAGLVTWEAHLASDLAAVLEAGQAIGNWRAASGQPGLPTPSPLPSEPEATGLQWPEMFKHISGAGRGLHLASVEVPRPRAGAGAGVQVIISGSGDLDRILAFEKDVVEGPVRSAALVSLNSRDGSLAFQVRAEWCP